MNEALLGMLFKAFPPDMIVSKMIEKFGPELEQGFEFVKNIHAVAEEFLASQRRIEANQREILAILKGEQSNAEFVVVSQPVVAIGTGGYTNGTGTTTG